MSEESAVKIQKLGRYESISLWRRFEKTPVERTKAFRTGRFSGTAINPAYVIQRLTEEFGPCGMGWNFDIEDERIDQGHILSTGEPSQIHIVRGHIKYRVDDEWYRTASNFGETVFVGEHGDPKRIFTDEDAPKKSITDCLGKCALFLGIGADIFLGLYDDVKYVSQLKAEAAGEGNRPKSEPVTVGKPVTSGKKADDTDFLKVRVTNKMKALWGHEDAEVARSHARDFLKGLGFVVPHGKGEMGSMDALKTKEDYELVMLKLDALSMEDAITQET